MAKITFIHGNPQRGGNSRLKLLVYLDGRASAETWYSFDGRYHQTRTKRLTDDEKYFTEDNARRYLQNYFADTFRHHPQLRYAAIVDSRYPTPNIKHRVWDRSTGAWVSPKAANATAHQAHIAVRTAKIPELYSFRLSVPLLKKTATETSKWKTFWTTRTQTGMALIDLIGQYHTWRKATPSVRPQSIGQFWGKPNGHFSTDQADVPRFGWYDVVNSKPKYHGTQRVITEYAAMQEVYGNLEETLSNYAA